jgi:hypothetical protein
MMSDIPHQAMSRRLSSRRQCCLWLLLVLLPLQIFAAPPTEEYKLKAALIYKLSKFVEWPAPAATGKPRTFGICLLGEDAFGAALDALEGRKAAGQPIRVQRFSQSEAIDSGCQMLFISESKQAFLGSILQNLQQQPILTLGDTKGFAEQGGMIQFTRGRKRIGFKINLESTKQSGLKIAAPLLELATIIGSPDKQTEQ